MGRFEVDLGLCLLVDVLLNDDFWAFWNIRWSGDQLDPLALGAPLRLGDVHILELVVLRQLFGAKTAQT